MLRVAIVEDDLRYRRLISESLERYCNEHQLMADIELYENGASFVFDYHPGFDVVLLDIEMPVMNGMEAAHAIRKKDSDVIIVFITAMANYAIQGYEVNAQDFIVKPFAFEAFSFSFDRIMRKLEIMRSEYSILIQHGDETKRVSIYDLRYIEVFRHMLTYHLTNESISAPGTMREVQAALYQHGFYQCSKSFLINLRYVTRIDTDELYLGDVPIRLRRGSRKELVRAITEFYGHEKRGLPVYPA